MEYTLSNRKLSSSQAAERTRTDRPHRSKIVPEPVTSGRSQLATLKGVQILATGSYAPENVVSNGDLAQHGFDEDWIIQRTGIHERRMAPPELATSDVAYEAALRCLDSAGASASDVDLILVATMTPDSPLPSTACLLQQRLGCVAPAVDLNAACAGFMYALVTASQYVKTGCSRRPLVIGVDLMSRVVNPTDEKTYPLFGDGGGAVLLGSGSSEQGLLSYTLGSEGDVDGILCQPAGGTREPLTAESLAAGRQYIHMEGRSVFKWAVRVLIESTWDVLHQAGMEPKDIDLVVFHQANVRIIDAALDDLHFERDKVLINLNQYGNTSAGSMPLVLDEAYRRGRLRRGDNVLLCGFGGGFTWGTAVMKW